MLWRTAEVTVSGTECDTEFRVAVRVVLPVCKALTRPVLLTVATEDAEELHCTWLVMFAVLPSE